MGATKSAAGNRRFSKGGIHIQLQKTTFISKEVIQGILYINLEDQFQGHIVQVTLEGFEETHFTYTTVIGEGNNIRNKIVQAHGFNQFLNFSIPVYDFDMGQQQIAYTLPPGQWQIPFQFFLADKLPSSINYFQSDSIKCSLKYFLKARIISTEENMSPIEGTQEIFIGQELDSSKVSTLHSINSQPSSCYCLTNDSMKIQVTTNQKQYSPSETMKIIFDTDLNGYNQQVKLIRVTLEGMLILKANNAPVIEYQSTHRQAQIIYVKESKVTDTVSFSLPSSINLTSTGDLIKHGYSISIEPEIDSFFCVSNNKRLVFPILINPSKQQIEINQAPKLEQVQQPVNWNPIQLQQPLFTDEQSFMIQQQQQQKQIQQLQQQYEQQSQQQSQLQSQEAEFLNQKAPLIEGSQLQKQQQQTNSSTLEPQQIIIKSQQHKTVTDTLLPQIQQSQLMTSEQQSQIIIPSMQQPQMNIANMQLPQTLSQLQQPQIIMNQQPQMIMPHMQYSQMMMSNMQQPQMMNNMLLPQTMILNNQQPQMMAVSSQQPQMMMVNGQQSQMLMMNSQQPQMMMTNGQQPQMMINGQQPQMILANGQQPQMMMVSGQQPQMIINKGQLQQMMMVPGQQSHMMMVNNQQPQMMMLNGQQPQMMIQQPQFVSAGNQYS